LLAANGVFAEVLGLDIIGLAKEKSISMANSIFTSTSTELEEVKIETVNLTENYVDQYLKDIEADLQEYASLETDTAKQKFNAQTQEITDLLEQQKQSVIHNGKAHIKDKIDSETALKLEELRNSLTLMLEEKFNP
jgi:thioesterase domain-containing protein